MLRSVAIHQRLRCMPKYSKTCVKRPLSKRPKMVFKTDYRCMQVKSMGAFCNTVDFHKATSCLIFVLSIFEWPFYTGVTCGIVSSKIYDKQNYFNFEIVNSPFLDGDAPRFPSYGVYISQLIRFARACSNVDDFNNRNLFLTTKLLKQGFRYHKIHKAFSKFYHRNSIKLFNTTLG